MAGDSIYSMTDKERLDHAIVVFTLLNEKLLADICKSIKEHAIKFKIIHDWLYADNRVHHFTKIIQHSSDREKQKKVYFTNEHYHNGITFKFPHIPE